MNLINKCIVVDSDNVNGQISNRHLGNNLHMTDFKSNIKNEKDSYGKGEN